MSAGKSMRKKITKAQRERTRLRPNGKAAFRFLGENMLLIGFSENDPLIYFLKSEPENLFNYYRISPEEEVRYAWDIRRHDPSHEFDGGRSPIDIVAMAMKELCHKEFTPEEFYGKPSRIVVEQDEKFGAKGKE